MVKRSMIEKIWTKERRFKFFHVQLKLEIITKFKAQTVAYVLGEGGHSDLWLRRGPSTTSPYDLHKTSFIIFIFV